MKDDTSKELLGMLRKAKVSSSATSKASSSKTVSKKEEVAETPQDSHSNSPVINEDSLLSSLRPKPASVESTHEDKVELSEPNTVRSILDRAKEVLKTLDYDGSSSSSSNSNEISKRGGIMRNSVDTSSRQFVNDTAKAVKQVAALAQTLVKHAEAKAFLKGKTSKQSSTSKKDGVVAANSNANQQQQNTNTKRGFVAPDPTQFGNTV